MSREKAARMCTDIWTHANLCKGDAETQCVSLIYVPLGLAVEFGTINALYCGLSYIISRQTESPKCGEKMLCGQEAEGERSFTMPVSS